MPASDPKEDMVAILMTQRLDSAQPSGLYLNFWTSAYQAIDDRRVSGPVDLTAAASQLFEHGATPP
jgi:hypothetical protein